MADLATVRQISKEAYPIRLYTNRRMTGNIALYRRCGFVETGTRPHPSRPGETLVDMVRHLDGRKRSDPRQ